MTQETIEGNILIAEFMGHKVSYGFGKAMLISTEKRSYTPAKYHTSWDWLMPVWKKIIDLKLIETEDMCIREPWQYMNPIRNAISDCDINEAWKCIVNLLTWYNLTQKH